MSSPVPKLPGYSISVPVSGVFCGQCQQRAWRASGQDSNRPGTEGAHSRRVKSMHEIDATQLADAFDVNAHSLMPPLIIMHPCALRHAEPPTRAPAAWPAAEP